MKITVFQYNGKISIKFEKHLIEHIWKLRDGSPLNDLEKLKSILSEDIFHDIEQAIEVQNKMRGTMAANLLENDLEQFDEII